MTLGEDFPIDGSPETFWQRILGQMDKPVVSAVVGEKDGFFEIGKIPDGEYEGDLTTVPLQKVKGQTGTERFYQWKVATPSYRVSSSANDSKLVTRGSGQYRSAIVDSATSSMLIDREAAKRYHASINVTEKVTMKPSTRVAVKCNAALPDLFLGVTDDHGETRMVRVRGQSLIMPYDEGEVLPAYRSEISKENGCKYFHSHPPSGSLSVPDWSSPYRVSPRAGSDATARPRLRRRESRQFHQYFL